MAGLLALVGLWLTLTRESRWRFAMKVDDTRASFAPMTPAMRPPAPEPDARPTGQSQSGVASS